MNELKRCPFCGGEAEILHRSVHCNSPRCNAQPFTHGETRDLAIAAWNRRASLEAPLREPQQGWQPIETAPKDGTELLVWREDAGVFLAAWTCVNDLGTTNDQDRDELDETSLFQEDWFGGDAELGGYRLEGCEVPTHWMPLPPAPLAATPEAAVPMQAKERAVLRELLDAEEAQFPPAEEGQAVQTEWANRRHNAREAARALLAAVPQSEEGLVMNAQWLDRALALINQYAAELTDDYDPSEARMDAAYKALHAHLAAATKGTP